MRPLAMSKPVEPWSLTSLPEKLIKIGAKVVSHGRYVTFRMAEVAVPRQMFREILSLIARLRAAPAPASPADGSDMILRSERPRWEGCALSTGKLQVPAPQTERPSFWPPTGRLRSNILAMAPR